jgi:hypothetical protein
VESPIRILLWKIPLNSHRPRPAPHRTTLETLPLPRYWGRRSDTLAPVLPALFRRFGAVEATGIVTATSASTTQHRQEQRLLRSFGSSFCARPFSTAFLDSGSASCARLAFKAALKSMSLGESN